ncbi:MAG TPA: hypothetical protein DDW49_00720 [Deltaproteobacteria bacterium]|nr:MAG: hypothetical protein A2048_10720 [Deltaproteobacteria bacterium GWA2_45_12]HBF11906.1 hypothetical protein [Deltaproteobacteria bacterium]
MLLLDTCTLLWLVLDQDKLSARAKEAIQKNRASLFVSGISGFEVALLVKKGQLQLPISPNLWMQNCLRLHGLGEIPISIEVASQSVFLKEIHKDPADRFIIATAIANKLSILTPDKKIAEYSHVKVIW